MASVTPCNVSINRELKQHRGQRLVKNEFILYQRNSKLSRSVQRVKWVKSDQISLPQHSTIVCCPVGLHSFQEGHNFSLSVDVKY